MNFLQSKCLLNAGLDHSRSKLVCNRRNNFILGLTLTVTSNAVKVVWKYVTSFLDLLPLKMLDEEICLVPGWILPKVIFFV